MRFIVDNFQQAKKSHLFEKWQRYCISIRILLRAYKIVSNDKLIVSYRNGQYSVTTDEQYIAKKREDTAKVLCCSYFDNMFALGFSKDEAENIRSEDAGETKDQASGSKFIKFYGKSR